MLWVLQASDAGAARGGAFDDDSRILWTFKAAGAVVATPALSPDGETLYVASADRNLYALPTDQPDADPSDPSTAIQKWTGGLRQIGSTNRWRFPMPVYASPTVDADGAILVPCTDGIIYKITDQGTYGRVERAKFITRGTMHSPAIGEDGTVYAGSSDNHLYAYFPDGAVKWAFTASNNVATPVITDDEDIVFVSGAYVRRVSDEGSQLSEFTPRSAIHSIPALGEDGTIHFGANDERVYGLNSDGENVQWRFNTKKNVLSSPAVGADGRVYIASDNLKLYSFTTNGAVHWSRPLRAPIRSALSIGVDGTIYAGADDKRLYAFSPEDGQILWTIKTKAPVRSSAVLDAFGVVYFTSGKQVYAVQSDAMADDADEPAWPMFRKDARHTARATECRPFLITEPHVTGSPDFADSITLSNGLPASITIVVRAGAAVSYQWQLNGADIDIEENPSAATATLEIAAVSPLDAGEYTVTAFNDCGEVESDTFTLNIDSPPVITTHPASQSLLTGSTLTLRVEAAGTPPLRYQWYKDDVLQAGLTNAFFTLTNVTSANSGVYYVQVENQFPPPAISSNATVIVYDTTLTLADHPLGAGQRHSLATLSDHTLWAWGLNNFGQLGNGTSGTSGTNLVFRNRPNLIGTNGTVTTNAVWANVSGGSRGYDVATNQPGGFSMGIQTNGSLWAWGLNNRGQLGIGSVEAQRLPVRVGTDTNWVQAEAGATHVIALKRDGTIWTWGGNEAGQLGIGTTATNSLVPVRVGSDAAWVEVRAGGFFSLARRADGTIWGWGTNFHGQLGLGNNTTQRSPRMIGSDSNWVEISAGVFHSLGRKSNGSIWSWGRNNFGQLGLGTGAGNGSEGSNTEEPLQVGTDTDWRSIEAARFHSFAIKASGALWGWGANHFGQVGDGSIGSTSNTNDANRIAPVPIAPELTWRTVDAASHSLGMTTDGRIWGWGWNNHGQVGDGTGDGTGNNNRSIPVLLSFSADTNVISTNALPAITQQPLSQTISEGAPFSLTVAASGQAPLNYQWFFNSNSIPATTVASATNATLTITNAAATNAGAYHVIVNNLFGSATSSVARITITTTSGPPVITVHPGPGSGVFEGANVTFTVGAAGATPLFYQWRFKTNFISLATNATAQSPTLSLQNVRTNNSGVYDVIVTNAFGSVTSNPALLSVAPALGTSASTVAKSEGNSDFKIGTIAVSSNEVVITILESAEGGRRILEFKEALGVSTWQPLATNETHQTTFTDRSAPRERSRFYRVRTE